MRRVALVLAALAIVAAGCGTQKDEPGASTGPEKSFAPGSYMAELQQKGKIVVGVKFDVPQFGFNNPTTNTVEGFDVDMAKEIAKALGVKDEFVEAISKNRIPFIQEGKVDIVFSTMTITDERKKQIDFSDVYYVAAQSFLNKKGQDPMTVKTAAGKKVCTAKGSTSELNLPAVQPDVEMVLQDAYAQCVQLLRNDQVDAVSTDDVILLQFLKNDPDILQVSTETFSREPYGAGMKKGRSGFQAFVNGVIADLKSSGRWAAIYKKWVTPVTKKEPPEPPAADVKFSVTGLENPVTPPPTAAPSGSPAASAAPTSSP